MRAPLPRRRAFTLVELLVAMGIMLVLVGLSLLVANSGLVGNLRLTGGSDRVAGWLMQAKTKAKRDGAPRGVRFIPGPDGYIREAQLIEVPDPFNLPPGHRLLVGQWPNGAATERHVYIVGPNITDIANNVAVGDTLSIPTFGTIHRVTALQNTQVSVGTTGANIPAVEVFAADLNKIPDLGAAASAAATTPPTPTFATSTFGFLRQARPVFGEEPLVVPEGIAIDLVNSQIQPVTGNYDVVFSPNGEVQNSASTGRIVLWVRNPEASANPRAGGDVRANYLQAGEMSLVTVYSRTGAVAVHPVLLPPPNPAETDPVPGHDPFQYTRDGIASGL